MLACSSAAFSQYPADTTFWVGFMEHVDQQKAVEELQITALQNTRVEVSIPQKQWSKSYELTTSEVLRIPFLGGAANMGSEKKQKLGIKLTSSAPILVMAHQHANARSDASRILPSYRLGKNYVVMAYRGHLEKEVFYPSECVIVATRPNTMIEIVPSTRTRGGRSADRLHRFILQEGESWQLQAASPSGDLTGTRIKSNQPIALFSGAVWTRVPSDCHAPDNLYEQIPPISEWGKSYIAIPSEKASYDMLRIISVKDHNRLRVNGVGAITLRKGQAVDYKLSGKAIQLESDEPMLVGLFQISNGCNDLGDDLAGDPSFTILESIHRPLQEAKFVAPSAQKISENYINLIMLKRDAETATLDGAKIGNFTSLENNNKYVFKKIRVIAGMHTLKSEGCGFTANLYGYGRLESYGYAIGGGFFLPDKNAIPDGGCLGDTFVFNSAVDRAIADLHWEFGDGSMDTAFNTTHFYDSAGLYQVKLITENFCTAVNDTLIGQLEVSPPPQVKTLADTTACLGDTILLYAEGPLGADYFWTGPLDFFSEKKSTQLILKDTSIAGEYTIVATATDACYSLPGKFLLKIQAPFPQLSTDTLLCPGDEMQLFIKGKADWRYRWNTGATDSSISTNKAGVFWAEAIDSLGCTIRDSIHVIWGCPPDVLVPSSISPNMDGINDELRIYINGEIDDFHLKVSDLTGRVLFESKHPLQPWDGSLNGEPMEPGVFLWQLEFTVVMPEGPPRKYQRAGKLHLLR